MRSTNMECASWNLQGNVPRLTGSRHNEHTHRATAAVRARSGHDAYLPLRARNLDRHRHLLDGRRTADASRRAHGDHASGGLLAARGLAARAVVAARRVRESL